MLNEILRRVDRPRGPPPALVATAAQKSSQEDKEMRKEDSNRSHASLTSRASKTSTSKAPQGVDPNARLSISRVGASYAHSAEPGGRRTNFTPGAPHLFSTFTHYDLALQDVANTAEGRQNRLKFGKTRGSFTGKDDDISWVEWLVGSPLFDAFCALIVVSNSIFLGVEVQMGITYFDEGLPVSMSVVQYVYAAWFLLELVLRIRADGRNFIFSPDWSWNLLDIFVVATSLW
ncbi:CACNA1G, partial [Symbiodinium sp. CCMP2456]